LKRVSVERKRMFMSVNRLYDISLNISRLYFLGMHLGMHLQRCFNKKE